MLLTVNSIRTKDYPAPASLRDLLARCSSDRVDHVVFDEGGAAAAHKVDVDYFSAAFPVQTFDDLNEEDRFGQQQLEQLHLTHQHLKLTFSDEVSAMSCP